MRAILHSNDSLGFALALALGFIGLLPLQLALPFLLAVVAAAIWFGGFRVALFTAVTGSVLSQVSPWGVELTDTASRMRAAGIHLFSSSVVIALGGLGSRVRRNALDQLEALRESERGLLDFLDNAVVSMHRVGPDGRILWANRAELEMLGYTREEFVGQHISRFHLEQDVVNHLLERLASGEDVCDFPSQMRRKDGTVEDVLITSNARLEKGKFVNSRCFTRVVTKQKQNDDARALYAAIVATSTDAIISKSLDGRIRTWNVGAERLFGYSAAEMIGQPINIIIPSELQDEERSIIERIRRSERLEHYETVRVDKDGQRFDVSLSVSPVLDEQGQVVGASKVARDITDRKRAEQALRASEARFRTMADAAPVLIWIADADKRAQWFNKQWLAFTGRSMEEQLGDGWRGSVHPEDLGRLLETYGSNFDQHRPYSMEYRLWRADGCYRWMLVNGMPLYEAGGELVGNIGSCIDITDRKDAERALREADHSKNKFLATLAHELRNPLAPISNSLEVLKCADQDPKLLQQSRETIERQLAQMVRLVDDLLNISRISRDKITLRTKRVDLTSVVHQALETVQPIINQLNHELYVRLPEETIWVEVDPVRLSQVFSNLLNNACKFTRPGGRIVLDVEETEPHQVSIRVSDSGTGIPPNQLDSIFNMFGQADADPERPAQGLGIGLTLAKRLVEMHGGEISVHSEGEGRGSEFNVSLPVVGSGSATEQPPIPAPAAAEQENRRILVVDDNHDSAETLAVLLRVYGHSVELAHDGEEAVQRAEQFRPNVILLDIGLPKLDGYEACRRIRDQHWGSTATIVAVTGWGQDNDRQRSELAGFDAHLVKPVSAEALNQVLEEEAPQRASA